MPDLNLAEPLRSALVNDLTVIAMVSTFNNAPAVFTRRPVPDAATYPLMIVSPDINITDQDGVNDRQPIVRRDISVYGSNETAALYRAVETLAYRVREMFHSKRDAITVVDFGVIDIRASGPRPAPVDDDQTVGRVVSLTIRLARKGSS